MPREIPLDTASGPPKNGREISLDTAAGPQKAQTFTDIAGQTAGQFAKDFSEPFVQYGEAEGRSLKDINEGLGGMVTGVGQLDPGKVFKGGAQALKGDVGSLVNQFGLVGSLLGGAPLHAVSAPIKRATTFKEDPKTAARIEQDISRYPPWLQGILRQQVAPQGIDLEQAVSSILPGKTAAGAAEAAQALGRAEPFLGGAVRQFLPGTRAAKRFVKANPKEAFLARAQASRQAGVEPSVVGVSTAPGLRLARHAKVVSPEAQEMIEQHAEATRGEAAQGAADRIALGAPHGGLAPPEVVEKLNAEQDELASTQFRPAYAEIVDVPDRVLSVVRTPKTRSELNSVIETEVERAAHPERYPDAPRQVEELRELATYGERQAEWEVATAKYEADKAAYDAEAKRVGAESDKATKTYEGQMKAAKTRYEKAKAKWEADKLAYETSTTFTDKDFTRPPGKMMLDTLNSKVNLGKGDAFELARIKSNQDKFLAELGYKGRQPYSEPEPTLEALTANIKKPKKVTDLKAPEDPGPPPARPRVSGGALDRLRIGLRDRGRALYTSDRGLGGALSEHARAINESLDGLEGLKPARAAYREYETRKRLLEIPSSTLIKSPGNFRLAVQKALNGQKMTPQMRTDLTHALISGLAEEAGKSPNGARQVALRFLRGGNFKRNIIPLLGEEKATELQAAMKSVVGELKGLDAILGGSTTADKQSDKLRENVDALFGGAKGLRGDWLGALHSVGRIINRRLTTMTEADAIEVAKFFSEGKTPEEVYEQIEALINQNSVPNNAPRRIKAILNKAIGAQAISNLGRVNPERSSQ